MSADPVRDLFARSLVVRAVVEAVVRACRALEAAARSSRVSAILARARREHRALTTVHRVRLAGLLVLAALATEQLLMSLVPAQGRPAPPFALRDEVAVAALILIFLAGPIARAWPTSRLRNVLRG
jgi:hypothetical protein